MPRARTRRQAGTTRGPRRRVDCPAVVIMIVTTTVCVFTDDIIGWYCRELRLLLSPFNFNFVVAVF